MGNNDCFFRISELVGRYIIGNLTFAEKKELQKWVDLSVERRVWLKVITARKYIRDKRSRLKSVNVEDGWLRMKIKLQREKRRILVLRWIKIAVMIAVLLGGSLFLTYRDSENKLLAVEKIVPGKNRAVLELANGRVLDLELLKVVNNKIAENIIVDSCRLDYTRPDSLNSTELTYNKLYVPRGGVFQVVLEDGTKVWLNSESRFIYPEVFLGNDRVVYLEGEAYFDVAPDSVRPFIVYSGIQKVKVLGTGFGVTHYKDACDLSVTLVHGKVQVEYTEVSDEVFLLRSGHHISFNYANGNIERNVVDVNEYVAWKDGKYVFAKKRLEDILETLARWYDFQIFYQSSSVKERLFSGELMRFESFNDILSLIGKVNNVKFSVSGKTVIVSEN